ncbi:MAG TPA: SDR family NAD(P)-dependent oxidoreductase [Acidimicrobiales bacterium]|nr:SDR family NAD(P)-dependent oxidoreductase [Acidimicrobiales bacterium]
MKAEGTALVTGASRGIGRAVAVELAVRGFDVVATMRNPADGADLPAEAAAAGAAGKLTVAALDVTDPTSIVVPDGLRVLVNNAGIDVDHTPVEHADTDAWRAMFETNVLGLLAVTRAALPALRANAPAVVANVTSSSILAPVAFYAGYRGSKAAVSALCDSLRVEMAPFGVRVVEILPGPVDTDMFRVTQGLPPAARFDDYRAMAEAAAEVRRVNADPLVVPPAQAAIAIVDALLDDDGPMRYSCDPLGTGLLDLWRRTDDESLHRLVTGAPPLAAGTDDAAPPLAPGDKADRTTGTSGGAEPFVAVDHGDDGAAGGDRGVVRGHVPGHLLTAMGMRRVDDPEAGPSLEMDVRPEVTNPHGGLHGGLMATLIECGAASIAVRACDSEMIVAGDLLVRFLSPLRIGPARVVGRALRTGRRQVVVQADVIDVGDDRRLVASSTLAYTRLDPPAG